MKKGVEISKVLLYYDVPQIFISEDIFGCSYISMLIEENGLNCRYSTVAISADRKNLLLKNELDLREVFINPEVKEYYLIDIKGNNTELILQNAEFSDIPEEYLPENGIKFDISLETNDLDGLTIDNDRIEKNNVIAVLKLINEHNEKSIQAEYLSTILYNYQRFISNVYKKTIAIYDPPNKKMLLNPINHQMRVYATSEGSFKIHMFSNGYKDLFGESFLANGLKNADSLLNDFHSEDEYFERIKDFKGHAINSLKNLVKSIMVHNMSICHYWGSPSESDIHSFMLSNDLSAKIYNILNKREELSEEIKIIIGEFVQIDAARGTWRVFSKDEKIYYHGHSDKKVLEGIIIKTKAYYLECLEITENNRASDLEQSRYIIRKLRDTEDVSA